MPGGRPFQGLRVLDSTYVIAAPYAAGMLADLGAEVVKIEGPDHADILRSAPPSIHANNDPGADPWNRGSLFELVNRGKLSLVLDLNHEKGRGIFIELIKKSDILMENFTPRVMKRWGLDYPNLRKINPRIIMCSNTGYGHGGGPYSSFPAQGTSLEAMHGHVHVTGYQDGPPSKAGLSYVDFVSTFTLLFAIGAALHHRHRTGEGQWIDVGMYQTGCMMVGEYITDYRSNGRTGARIGNRHPFRAPQGVYRALGEDEWVAVSVGTDEQWKALCRVMGRHDLASDSRFADNPGRMEHHDELDRAITEWTVGREKYEAMQLFQEAEVPSGPVFNARDTHLNPQFRARGFLEKVSYPPERRMGDRLVIGRPWKISNAAIHVQGPAPTFGQDNVDVLTRLVGLDEAAIRALESEGIIGKEPEMDRQMVVMSQEEWVRSGRQAAWDMDYREKLGQRAE